MTKNVGGTGTLSAEKRKLLDRILAKRGVGDGGAQTIQRRSDSDPSDLSFAQGRLWFLHQLEPDAPVYNVPDAYRLHGPLNVDAFERAVNAIIHRHDVLRTTFAVTGGSPVQVISPSVRIAVPVVDLTDLEDGERQGALERMAQREARQPFDLGGHSLLATQVVSRLYEAFQVEIPVRRLFETRSVAGLVEAVATVYGGRELLDDIARTIQHVDQLSEEEIRMQLAQEA